MKTREYEITRGNIFSDLGLPGAEQLDIKANLAIQIIRIIERRGLTQVRAADIMGIDQPKVSMIVRGHLEKFSVERLCELLAALGCEVTIELREKSGARPLRFALGAARS